MNRVSGGGVSLLFMILLFFALGICSLFAVLTGARVYENINVRMEQNFSGQTALSYISNKISQADREGMVGVDTINGIDVLVLAEDYDGIRYQTWIYCENGYIKELFSEADSGLTLADGIDIMECNGLRFTQVSNNLLKVELTDEVGDIMYVALRSESGGLRHDQK